VYPTKLYTVEVSTWREEDRCSFFALPSKVDQMLDWHFMEEALREARKALKLKEVPVGVAIVRWGKVIARACNQVETLRDATAHAEILAIRQAENIVGDWRLTDCTLYVTKEPCPMCAGAMVQVRLNQVVFGCSDPSSGGAGGRVNLLQMPGRNHHCKVVAGVRNSECRRLLKRFFACRRLCAKAPDRTQKMLLVNGRKF